MNQSDFFIFHFCWQLAVVISLALAKQAATSSSILKVNSAVAAAATASSWFPDDYNIELIGRKENAPDWILDAGNPCNEISVIQLPS